MKLSALTSTHYTFEGRKSYERVLVLLYRHWFVLVVKGIVYIILAILPFFLADLMRQYLTTLGLMGIYWFAVGLYFLVWWLGLFYAITMYLLDTWIVTDHRALDSQQFGFFDRSVSELNLAQIQDISVVIRGPVETFLDFGDLEIQTAGAARKFLFEQIPHPNHVREQIMQARNDYMRTHRGGQIEIHEEKGA